MCRVSKNEVKIFLLIDLTNQKSKYLEPILKILNSKGFVTDILKTNYEFQKGGNEMLKISLK